MPWARDFPGTGPVDTRDLFGDLREVDVLFANGLSVGVEDQFRSLDPSRAEDLCPDRDRVARNSREFSRSVLVVDRQRSEQSVTDSNLPLQETVHRHVDIDLAGIGIVTADVSPPLPDEVPRNVVRVARTDGRDLVTSIQQCHPVSKQLQNVGLRRGRIDDLHRVGSKLPAIDVDSGGVIKQLRPKRSDA